MTLFASNWLRNHIASLASMARALISLTLALSVYLAFAPQSANGETFSSPNLSYLPELNPTIQLTPDRISYTLTPKIVVVKDHSSSFTPEQALQTALNTLPENEQIITRMEAMTYWMVFTIDTSSLPAFFLEQQWLLEFINAPDYAVEIFQLNQHGETDKKQRFQPIGAADTSLGLKNREYPHHNLVIPFDLNKNQTTTSYVIRFETKAAIRLNLRLQTEDALLVSHQYETFFWSTFYGIVLIVIMHNLVAYLLLQDRPSVFYILTVITVGILISSLNGLGYYWIWHPFPAVNDYIINLSFGAMLFFAWQFIVAFLKTSSNSPWSSLINNGFAAIALVLSALAIVLETNYLKYGFPYVIIFLFGMLYHSIKGLRKNDETAVLIVGFCIAYVIGLGASVLVFFDLIPSSRFTFYSKELGAIIGMIIISLGLSNRINNEQKQKSQALALIDEKSASIRFFSHEIRTPLNAIAKFSELALKKDRSTEQHRDDLQEIDHAAKALKTLMQDIIDMERMEKGSINLVAVPFTLAEVINASFSIITPQAREKNLILNKPRIDSVVQTTYLGDPARLRQVFVNLLANAVKFTDQGEVSLRVEFVNSYDTFHELLISVRDTGMGIPSHKIPQLFNSFTQADTSTARKFGGSGLGLKISKELISLMNGDIWVESKQGLGSQFYIKLNLNLYYDYNSSLSQWVSSPSPVSDSHTPYQSIDLTFAIHNLKWTGTMLTAHLQGFLETYKNFAQEIRQDYNNKDYKTIERKSHSLKSSANGLGARQLNSIAEKCQQACKKGSLTEDNLSTLTVELERVYQAVQIDINQRGRQTDTLPSAPSIDITANNTAPETNSTALNTIASVHLNELNKLLKQFSGQSKTYFLKHKNELTEFANSNETPADTLNQVDKLEHLIIQYRFESAAEQVQLIQDSLIKEPLSE